MTDWRTIHRRLNPDMLFAEDLGDRTSIDVEIVNSGVERVKQRDGKYKDMPVLYFKGAKKRLGLGATMCKTLTTMTATREIEKWRGWITLIVVKTTYRDQDTGQVETTDAIRIAPRRPRPHDADKARLEQHERDTAPVAGPKRGDEERAELEEYGQTPADHPPPAGDGYTFDPDAVKEDGDA